MTQGKSGAQGRAQNPDVLGENPSFEEEDLDALRHDIAAEGLKPKERDPKKSEAEVGIKKGSTLDASRLAREVERSDLDQAHDLSKIDIGKLPETKEEKEAFELFKNVLPVVLSVALAKGLSVDKIRNFPDVQALDFSKIDLKSTEKAELAKLVEIAKNPNSPLYDDIAVNWNKTVEKAYADSRAAQQLAHAIKADVKGGKPDEKGFVGKTYEAVKNAVKEHPVLTAAVVAAGVFGIYKLFSSDKSSEAAKGAAGSSESTLDSVWKWGKRLAIGAGVVFAAGRLMEWQTFQEWIQKSTGADLSNQDWSKAIMLLSHGKFKEAFEVMFKGQENEKMFDDLVDMIEKEKKVKISRRTLEKISIIKYGDFMQVGVEGYLNKAKDFGVEIASKIPGIGLSETEIKETKVIREYFKDHDKEMRKAGVIDSMLMVQVYSKLTGVKWEAPRALEGNGEYEGVKKSTESIKDPAKRENVEQMLALAFSGTADYPAIIGVETVRKYIEGLDARKIDTNPLKEKLTAREKASDELNKLIAADAAQEEIQDKIEEIVDLNDDIVDLIEMRYGWDEFVILLPQGLRNANRWRKMPKAQREAGKWASKKLLLDAPRRALKAASRVAGRGGLKTADDFRKAADDIDVKISGHISPTKAEMAEWEKKASSTSNPTDQLNAKRDLHGAQSEIAEKNLLKKQAAVYREKALLVEAEHELTAARSAKKGASEIATLEKRVKSLASKVQRGESSLISLRGKLLKAESTYMSEWVFNPKRIEHGERSIDKVLRGSELERFGKFEKGAVEYVKSISDQIVAKNHLVEKLLKEGKKVEAEKVVKEINALSKKLTDADKMFFEAVNRDAKFLRSVEGVLRKHLAGAKGEKAAAILRRLEQVVTGKSLLRNKFTSFLSKTKERALGGRNILPVKLTKGKLAFVSLVIAGGALGADEQTGIGSSMAQAAVDVAPVSGTLSDFYSVFSGKEVVTGRKLDWSDRGIRAAFGVAGAVCDISILLAGLGLGLRAGLSAVRGGLVAAKVAKAVKAVDSARDAVKTVSTGVRVADGAADVSKAGKAVRTLRKVAIAGALGTMGYSLLVQDAGEMDVAPETQEILGDDLMKEANQGDVVEAPDAEPVIKE
ncbi:MAG: hypothetical protein US89_C0016G0017 [Candidatus Peregrinibacteria bacterium GW2011_GWF2_38_29]|nr:MAG: hypothetical protein US89_C0016G0017 [Candidatus Peregrinibacteria bacterium GW2011_GWF2_38_29]HBB03130.1 hypothetical protein [Candidatus Peregrinibacteria bacterium]